MSRGYDLVIVGMGSAGMVAAEFAATLPIKVAAVERGRLGGDCLWTGCVPSKALLASAKAAHTIRHAAGYGIRAGEPEIDTAAVWSRIKRIQLEIASSDDSPEHFRDELGIELLQGPAALTGKNRLRVGEEEIEARYVLLCTGSRPAEPPIPGLAEAGFLTSESVFGLDRAPESLILVGGGPIAIEMAQAFNRLGIRTTVLELAPNILSRDEPDLAERVAGKLRAEGVDLNTGVEVERVEARDGRKVVFGGEGEWEAEEILVATGRQPNVEGLGLGDAGVRIGKGGIETDGRMRTSADWVYAAGDVAGGTLFTHSAGFEAARAVRNMFFPGSAKADYAVPWCTFTDPELAHAGMTAQEAVDAHGADAVRVFRQEMSHSDRARAEGAEEGAIVLVAAKGKLVGAHVLAPGAGEVIHELALAMHKEMSVADLASVIHVYPTISIGVAQLAAEAAYDDAGRYGFLVRSKA